MWRIRVNPRKVAHATTRRAQLDTTAIFLPLRQRSWGRGPGRGGAVKMVEEVHGQVARDKFKIPSPRPRKGAWPRGEALRGFTRPLPAQAGRGS